VRMDYSNFLARAQREFPHSPVVLHTDPTAFFHITIGICHREEALLPNGMSQGEFLEGAQDCGPISTLRKALGPGFAQCEIQLIPFPGAR